MKTIYHSRKHDLRLINGETVTTLVELADRGELFDGMLTDPPYASGGLHTGTKMQATSAKYQETGVKRKFPDFEGDARSQLSWLTWSTVWMNAARRILKIGAPVLMFCDWRQLAAAIQAIQAGGFIYRGLIPWDKKNARPQPGRFRQQCEFVLFATRGAVNKEHEVYLSGLFTHTPPSGKLRQHATQKPVPLLVDLLEIVPPGGRILDPFAGSGTTLHAARVRDLGAVAIEESLEIANNAAVWLREKPAKATAA